MSHSGIVSNRITFRVNDREYAIVLSAAREEGDVEGIGSDIIHCDVQRSNYGEGSDLAGLPILSIITRPTSTTFDLSGQLSGTIGTSDQPRTIGIAIGNFLDEADFQGRIQYWTIPTSQSDTTPTQLESVGEAYCSGGKTMSIPPSGSSEPPPFESVPTICVPNMIAWKKVNNKATFQHTFRSAYQPKGTALTFMVPRYHEETPKDLMCPLLVHVLEPDDTVPDTEDLSQLIGDPQDEDLSLNCDIPQQVVIGGSKQTYNLDLPVWKH